MKPSWKNTLVSNSKEIPNIKELANTGFKLGYSYMVWSDRIYSIYFKHPTVAWKSTNLTIDNLPNSKFEETVVVAAKSDSSGSPVMVAYVVTVTQGQYDLGKHYDLAIELAENDGYEGPFITFDETEQPEIITMGKALLDNLD